MGSVVEEWLGSVDKWARVEETMGDTEVCGQRSGQKVATEEWLGAAHVAGGICRF